jgi:DNA polymerase III subunit epsilon
MQTNFCLYLHRPMFAIIDIETTGGSPGRDRITEIAILIHDGLTITERFSTLIHPERYIPEYITRLTGISNEMVENAPKFYEVARKIVELTEGMIFVAHNVNFDYNFVEYEFKSLGYKFKRDKLCTVRLSRKLLPGKKSYSLGRLCDSLGITIEGRHRAAGDAEATAVLFDILLAQKSQHPTYRKQNLQDLTRTRLDSVKEHLIKKLPEATGVYYFLDKAGSIMYVGKSKNIRRRAFSHLTTKTKKTTQMLGELHDVDFVLTGSELIALLLESEEIKKLKPKYNRARKQSEFSHSIVWFKADSGIINFRIDHYGSKHQALQSFPSFYTAQERLRGWQEAFVLCENYCSDGAEGACFYLGIKKCNGICCGEEEVAVYNVRAQKVIHQFFDPEASFLLVDSGREDDEQSIVWVNRGRFAGYGWLNRSDVIATAEDLHAQVNQGKHFPDSDDLVLSYLKAKPWLKKIDVRRD